MRRVVVLCLLLLVAPVARAQDCGTIVLPTGLGVAPGADITSINPLLSNSTYNQEMGDLMYQALVWVDGSGRIDWSRSVASSVTSPDNGTTYNVTLRSWHWSDGVPVTSADVAYTFKLIKELGTTYASYGAGGMPDIIKTLNIISPTRFQVVLKRQVNPTWFIYDGLFQLQPLPAHDWGRYSIQQIEQNQSDPAFFKVVDGPLRTARLDIGQDIVLVPNQAYEGAKVHFQRLVFLFLESDGATLQAVESGEADMADVPLTLWNAVQHLPGLHIVALAPPNGYNFLILNFRNPNVAFLRDVRVRQAIADALDQPGMIRYVFHGNGVPAYLPVSVAGFLSPALRAGAAPVGHDPGKARALLRQAGFTPGPDGVMQRGGERLSFTDLELTGDATIEQMTIELQAELHDVGIEMKLREIEFNQMLALLNSGGTGWQAALLAQNAANYPTGEDTFSTGGYNNSGGYSDAKMDRLIAQSTDRPGLDGLYGYEDYVAAQQPIIFIAENAVPLLVRDGLRGAASFVDPLGNYYPDQLSCAPGYARS